MKSLLVNVLMGLNLFACGDVIKAPTPWKKREHKPADSVYDYALSARCINFEAKYEGICTPTDPNRIPNSTLLLSQAGCQAFGIFNGETYHYKQEQTLKNVAQIDVTTLASWTEDFNNLSLKATWTENGFRFQHTHELSGASRSIKERKLEYQADGSEKVILECEYHVAK